MRLNFFSDACKVLRRHGKERVVGATSLSCLILLIAVFSTLLAGRNVWVILVIFFTAICFFVNLLKLQNALFDGWSKDIPKFIHWGIIVATVIMIIPLCKKLIYGRNEQTN
jgi:hypothetical protein